MAHYELGEFAAAVDEFKHAYARSQAPGLLFNLAQASRLNKDYEQALHFYRTYLRVRPDAANRDDVEKRIAELEPIVEMRRRAEVEKLAATAAPVAEPARAPVEARATPLIAHPLPPGGKKERIAGIVVGVAGVGALAAGIGLGVASLDAQNKLSSLATQNGSWTSGAGEPLPERPARRRRGDGALRRRRRRCRHRRHPLRGRLEEDRARFAVAPTTGRRRPGGVLVRVLAAAATLFAVALAAGGCVFAPKLGDGAISCGSDGSCPPGQGCGDDGRCHVGLSGTGGNGGNGPDASIPCTPIACSDVGRNCGPLDDGCGNMLDCGTCNAPDTCGGAGTAGVCGCRVKSCGDQGKDCGAIANGCGATRQLRHLRAAQHVRRRRPGQRLRLHAEDVRAARQELRQHHRRLRRHDHLRHAGRLSVGTELRRRGHRQRLRRRQLLGDDAASRSRRTAATSPTAAR